MIAFCHIQKTAGTTIHRILQRSYGARHCAVEPMRPYGGSLYYESAYMASDHEEVQRRYPRLASIAGHLVKPWSDLDTIRPDVRWVVFLRDPLVRSASHYQHMVQRAGYTGSCEAWLEEIRFRNMQTRHVAGCDDVEAAIRLLRERRVFVGLQERFEESLVLLRAHLGDPRLDIRFRSANVSPDDRLRRRLLEEERSRGALARANRSDVALYEWARKELFPEQRRLHGAGLEDALRRLHELGPAPRWSARVALSRGLRLLLLRPAARRHRREPATERSAPSPPGPCGAPDRRAGVGRDGSGSC